METMPVRIVVKAFWDDEAQVWVASSADELGLATEADTIEDLRRELAVLVPDLLGEGQSGPHEVELLAHSIQTVAA